MKLIEFLKDLLFPKRCPICDDILPFGKYDICEDCKTKVVYIEEPFCMKCGKALSHEAEYCNDCVGGRHIYEQGCSVFDYGSIAGSLYRFKNRNRREYAQFYATQMIKRRGDWIRSIHPDAFIPVPIHKSKKRQRGYNQSKLLADALSEVTSIPVFDDVIIRAKKTTPLKDLSLSERQKYLKKAFKVVRNDVKLKTIIIIDDIYTTGSTVDEMAAVLKEQFDCKIYFMTVTIGRGI